MAASVLERVNEWDWEEPVEGEDRPLVVAYDVRDLLANIQRGVDSANSALALKADRTDLSALSTDLHKRMDSMQGHQDDINVAADKRLGKLEARVAAAKGWRDGFLVAAGLATGMIGALLLHAAHVI